MSGDPADQVLLIAQNTDDLVTLKALKLLLEEAEPYSVFFAPQLITRVWHYEEFGRLRILQSADPEDISKDSLTYFTAYVYFHERGLPIAYHTLILTTTEG